MQMPRLPQARMKTLIEVGGPKTLRITPGSEVSLGKLQRALQLRQLEPVISWQKREIYLPAAVFDQVCEALEGINLDVSSDVASNQKTSKQLDEYVKRGKEVLNDLLKPGAAQKALSDFAKLSLLDPHQV